MNYETGPSHLGDCIWTMIHLRKIPGAHTLFCPSEYNYQLQQCNRGIDIVFSPLQYKTSDALCTWIGCQRFAQQGLTWHNGPDVVDFLMKWGNNMCRENGVAPQFNERASMLADWPAIQRHCDEGEFDALVINCPPRSGQCPRWRQDEMDELIAEIGVKHRTLVTNPTTATNVRQINRTISEIGNLHLQAKFTVALASGAHWGCHSVWSQEKPLYLFLDDPLFLDYGRKIPHHGLVCGMRDELRKDGWL